MVHAPLGPPSPGVPTVHSTFRSFHQPWEIDQTRQLAGGTHYVQPMYCTDVIVPIKVQEKHINNFYIYYFYSLILSSISACLFVTNSNDWHFPFHLNTYKHNPK